MHACGSSFVFVFSGVIPAVIVQGSRVSRKQVSSIQMPTGNESHAAKFDVYPPLKVMHFRIHGCCGFSTHYTGELLSDRGKSAVLYTFKENGIRKVLKVPRNRDVENGFMTETTGSYMLSKEGFNVPDTKMVRISYRDTLGKRTSYALVKTLLYGHDLFDVITGLSRGDSTFDPYCLAHISNASNEKIRALSRSVLDMDGESMFPYIRLWGKGRECRLGRTIQKALKCFFARVAAHLTSPEPHVLLTDLKAENFMWATAEVGKLDEPKSYKLWLVDALFYDRAHTEFTTIINQYHHIYEKIWQHIYQAQWEMGGPGRCEAVAWPQLLLPDTLAEALEWSPFCKNSMYQWD